MPAQILAIRAQVEGLEIDEESLAYLGEIGQQASLRSDLTCWFCNARMSIHFLNQE